MPTVWFQFPSFKTCSTQPARRENDELRFQVFRQVFQHDLTDFKHQIQWFSTRFKGKTSDLAKSLSNPARSHRILDGLGEILPIFYFFGPLWRVSTLPETTAHPTRNWPIKPDPNTGQLRVRHLSTRSPSGWLRVGHKLDPWTALLSVTRGCNQKLTILPTNWKRETFDLLGQL